MDRARFDSTVLELKEKAEAFELQAALAARGIIGVYGGGRRSKGHGFWLYTATPAALARYQETGGYTHLDDVAILTNDGKRSGNPCFHMFADAARFVS